MNTILGIAGLVFVSAVTPGPNNLAVLRIAGEQRIKATALAIMSIVLGGLALLVLIHFGLDTVMDRHSWFRAALTIGGTAYLAYLGAVTVYGTFRKGPRSDAAPLPRPGSTAWSLFAFQFSNPKAWVLITTAAAAVHGSGSSDSRQLVTLALLLTIIPIVCLSAWTLLGRGLRRYSQNPGVQLWITRAMGMLLMTSAFSLIAP